MFELAINKLHGDYERNGMGCSILTTRSVSEVHLCFHLCIQSCRNHRHDDGLRTGTLSQPALFSVSHTEELDTDVAHEHLNCTRRYRVN